MLHVIFSTKIFQRPRLTCHHIYDRQMLYERPLLLHCWDARLDSWIPEICYRRVFGPLVNEQRNPGKLCWLKEFARQCDLGCSGIHRAAPVVTVFRTCAPCSRAMLYTFSTKPVAITTAYVAPETRMP